MTPAEGMAHALRADVVEQRHAALVAALEALVDKMRRADKPNLAVKFADDGWADEIDALLRQHAGGLTPITPEETP